MLSVGAVARSVGLGLQRGALQSLLLLAVRPLVAAEGGGVQEHLPAGETGVGLVVAARCGAQVCLQVRLQMSRQSGGVAEAAPALRTAVSPPPGPSRHRPLVLGVTGVRGFAGVGRGQTAAAFLTQSVDVGLVPRTQLQANLQV